MRFNSLYYFLFLPVVYLVFYFAPGRWRWLVLLGASYLFYASFKAPYLLAVLIAVTGISYACGMRIHAERDEVSRKCWLWIGSFACVGFLAFMKYLPFLQLQGNIFGLGGVFTSAIISIGVSYFTFQAISYMADIYLEIEQPESHVGQYALYMAFFPKLLQGPIERAGDLLPQLKSLPHPTLSQFRSGFLLILLGLFKKVAIADRLSIFVDPVYADAARYSSASLLLATYAYAFQIYFDFSGYTDMARGAARIFGVNLTENFNAPYLSTSIAEYWRRWHITFSRWILDYIFKPLQMRWRNRGQAGTALALIITFLISGGWHGITWGFVIWGLLHGVYLSSSIFLRSYQVTLHRRLKIENTMLLKCWQIFVTFNLVSFAWIFFRADSVGDAWYIATHLLSWNLAGTLQSLELTSVSGGTLREFAILTISATLATIGGAGLKGPQLMSLYKRPFPVRFCFYYAAIMYLMVLGYYSNHNFVYVRF